MEIKINYSGRKIILDAKKISRLSMGLGLTFRSRNTDNLLFEFKKDLRIAITSFFVFFPFLVLWLDENNKVIEKKVVKPFRLSIKPEKKFRKFIEVPVNVKNKKIIEFFVGKRRKV